MTSELEYEKVESFRMKGILFTCMSKWNGLEEWRDDKGRKLIVSPSEPNGFASAFDSVLGLNREPNRLRIICGSPDLICEIQIA